MKFLSNLRTNWRTTVCGVGTLAVAAGATINGQPLSADLINGVLMAAGLIFASDGKVAQ